MIRRTAVRTPQGVLTESAPAERHSPDVSRGSARNQSYAAWGTVEKGKIADLVLLDADPLVDIRNTQKIAAVIINGRYLSRADLDNLLAGVETAAKGK